MAARRVDTGLHWFIFALAAVPHFLKLSVDEHVDFRRYLIEDFGQDLEASISQVFKVVYQVPTLIELICSPEVRDGMEELLSCLAEKGFCDTAR